MFDRATTKELLVGIDRGRATVKGYCTCYDGALAKRIWNISVRLRIMIILR